MSSVWWEWYCSLFPSTNPPSNDPSIHRCVCGHTFKFGWWQLLRMYLFEYYVYTCPQCQRRSRWRMIRYVVRTGDTNEIKRNNRWLD